jgi:hypothetical protein
MCKLLAQEFLLVQREIDDQQPSARPQHARRFLDRARAVVEKVQNLMQDDDVERVVAKRQIVEIALPHAAVTQARALQPVAREQQHIERQVEAKPTFDLTPEQLQHPSRAGAEIEQRAERLVGERLADRGLHRLVGDVQIADAVPLGSVLTEIGLRGSRPGRPDVGKPLTVAGDHRVAGVETLQHCAGHGRAAALLCQPEERPGPLAEALDQAGFGEQLEVPGDARLRLPQNVGQVGNGELGFGEQREHAQARLLAGGL